MAGSKLSLMLYSGITPNVDENPHCFFKTYSDYTTWLTSNGGTLELTIGDENYRYEDGRIYLSYGDVTPDTDLLKITYALVRQFRDTPPGTTYFLHAYHVKNVTVYSGMAVLEVTPDLWANSIETAKLEHGILSRTNKPVTGLLLDDPANGNDGLSIVRLSSTTPATNDYSLVMLTRRVESMGGLGNALNYSYELWGCGLANVVATIKTGITQGTLPEITADMVSGIHNIHLSGTDFNCEVLRAWIVPTTSITYNSSKSVSILNNEWFSTRSEYAVNNQISSFQIVETGKFSDTVSGVKTAIAGANVDYGQNFVYFGFPNNLRMKLDRFSAGCDFVVEYVFSFDGVDVFARQGSVVMEVTKAFELGVTANNSGDNAQQSTARILGKTASTIGTMAAGYLKGNYVGMALAGVDYLTSMFGHSDTAQGFPGSGDACTTFGITNTISTVEYPYRVYCYKSTADDRIKSLYYGGTCSKNVEGFASGGLKDVYALSGYCVSRSSDDSDPTPLTFVKFTTACVSGVPRDNKDYIENELLRGIFIDFVAGY